MDSGDLYNRYPQTDRVGSHGSRDEFTNMLDTERMRESPSGMPRNVRFNEDLGSSSGIPIPGSAPTRSYSDRPFGTDYADRNIDKLQSQLNNMNMGLSSGYDQPGSGALDDYMNRQNFQSGQPSSYGSTSGFDARNAQLAQTSAAYGLNDQYSGSGSYALDQGLARSHSTTGMEGIRRTSLPGMAGFNADQLAGDLLDDRYASPHLQRHNSYDRSGAYQASPYLRDLHNDPTGHSPAVSSYSGFDQVDVMGMCDNMDARDIDRMAQQSYQKDMGQLYSDWTSISDRYGMQRLTHTEISCSTKILSTPITRLTRVLESNDGLSVSDGSRWTTLLVDPNGRLVTFTVAFGISLIASRAVNENQRMSLGLENSHYSRLYEGVSLCYDQLLELNFVSGPDYFERRLNTGYDQGYLQTGEHHQTASHGLAWLNRSLVAMPLSGSVMNQYQPYFQQGYLSQRHDYYDPNYMAASDLSAYSRALQYDQSIQEAERQRRWQERLAWEALDREQ